MSKAVKLKNNLYLSSTSIVHKRGGKWYYLNKLLDNIYPVGSIFISTVNTNPSTYFGGTWKRIKGRFLLAADDSTYKLGGTGGESSHTLSTKELPGSVTVRDNVSSNGYGNQNWSGPLSGWGNYENDRRGVAVNKAHNNMPPYLVVYIWKRDS